MDKRFLTAFLSRKKYLVGGIELDGFCPRHSITLEGINSPLTRPDFDKNYSYKDLFLAMRICSTRNWEEAVSMPSFRDRIRYGMMKYDIKTQMSCLNDFLIYLRESTIQPKIVYKDVDGSMIKVSNKQPIPPTLGLTIFLMSKLGFTEEQAWNTPYSRISWYIAGYSAQETGNIETISTSEEENAEQDKKDLIEFTEKERERLKNLNKNGSR